MKHWTRFLGGLGTVVIIYGSLRALESLPAVVFIAVLFFLSYGMGFLLDRKEEVVIFRPNPTLDSKAELVGLVRRDRETDEQLLNRIFERLTILPKGLQ